MGCTLLYQDKEFQSPEELQKYGEENDIAEIKEAFHVESEPIDTTPKLPGDPELNKSITNFLEKRGIAVQSVDNFKNREGNKLNAVAKADMLSKLIEVVENRANESTLPEEASHFAVAMLDNTPLLKSMMDKITSYDLYKDTMAEYKGKKAYRNEDGTINLDKIKKEAIAKLVSDYILKNSTGSESEGNIRDGKSWWNKVLDYIRDLFSKEPGNPFKEVSDIIMRDDPNHVLNDSIKDEGEYYQTDNSLDKLEDDQNRIKLDNSIDPKTGQKRHVYTYDGDPAKGSVTQVYVDPYLKKLFKNYSFSEKEKETNLIKAEVGDVVHDEMDGIIKSWTDEQGLLRSVQSSYDPKTSSSIYSTLNNYAQEVLASFPEGTIFKSEQKIFDKSKKIGGSVDFMAITPDGKLNILDWKSQEIFKGQEDLKAHKPETYRIQLEEYKKILQSDYGFKDFGTIRAIPMKVDFIYNQGTITGVKGLEVGDVNPRNIPESKNYLVPVPLKNEKTGDEQIDSLLVKLNGIKDDISSKKVSRDQVFKKREEITKINNAIRDLQVKRKIDGLVDLGLTEFDKYNEKMQAGTLSGKDIWEAKRVLEVFSSSSNALWDLSAELQKNAKDSENPITMAAYNETKEQLLSMNARTSKLLNDLEGYTNKAALDLARPLGFERLLSSEKPVGNINGLFANLSKITQKSFQTFYKVLSRAQNTADARFGEDAKTLAKLEKGFKEWSSKIGVDWKKGLSKIFGEGKDGKWNGNFLAKWKPEFYDLRQKAIESGDKKWLLDNLQFDQDKYKAGEAKQIEWIKEFKYSANPEKNEDLIQKKILEFKRANSIMDDKGALNERALFNPSNRYLTPIEEWHTDKWVDLQKPENSQLKDTYDFFMEKNQEAQKLGMIDQRSSQFLPSIYADRMDQIVFGNLSKAFNTDFFKDLEIDPNKSYAPEVHGADGSILNQIPSYFTKDMGKDLEDGNKDFSDKSQDIFKVYGIYLRHMRNYEAMQDIEDSSLLLLEVEKNKGSLLTDSFGKVILKNGEVQVVNKNDRNAELLEKFVNFYLYDKRTGWGADTEIKLPFSDKVISLQKTWSSALMYTGLKTRALNPFSGTASFVGGTANALFIAKKGIFFNTGDWVHALHSIVSNSDTRAAVKWANVNLEDSKSHIISQLALHSLSRNVSIDKAYIMQQYGYAGVENIIAAAMIRTHMLQDGKIVDINKFVKEKYDYNNTFYNLSKDERSTLQSKISDEVQQLKDTQSLLKLGVVKDGEFSLPGVDKTDDTFSDFRNKTKGVIKTVLGNIGSNDISAIRTTLLGMTLMQYRSWIPDTIAERFAGYQYNPELDSHTIGKANLFFSELFSKRMPALAKALVAGFGDNAIQAASDRYDIMAGKALERGEEFNISKGEFTDLYIGNMKSQMSELITLAGFAACVLSITGGGHDPDDRDFQGMKKYMNRALKRYYTDFAFYYNPLEFTKLIKNPVPAIGLAEDFVKFTNAFSAKAFGEITGNQKIIDSAQPSKYFLNMVPVAHQLMLFIAAQDDDFRKEWGIKVDQ